ncbi:heparinase II/III family protein [Pseudomonadota bacterium]
MNLIKLCFFCFITVFVTKIDAVERPFIWVTESEKTEQINKIATHEWAKQRFAALVSRTDVFAPNNLAQRNLNVKKLPLHWEDNTNDFPGFIEQKNVGNNHLREPLQLALQGAIDCGVLYYLTNNQKYAQCGADILYTVVKALDNTPIQNETVRLNNKGWIVPDNHLLEARIYGAQIPIIYDFVYPYLSQGGRVFDAKQQRLVKFDFDAAQQVFTTYAQLALDSGLVDNNWPVLESTSLVHNALAIDDEKLREHYLNHYLNINTPNQDSLAKVAKSYLAAGDIWPESLNYSIHVAYFSLYLMDAIDRIKPDYKLGAKYPNIATSLLFYDQLRYPNGDFPAFGDGNRYYKPDYFKYELAYLSASLNNNQESMAKFSSVIKHAIESKKYDRATLKDHHITASPYYEPLGLLWPVVDLGDHQTQNSFSPLTTVEIPFAGIFIQRNLHTQDPIKSGLMATLGGGSYVHGHASGIDMELYGQGHVIGVEAGKGNYVSDVHQNYNRLFAGHNTVISNGASASKGGWIDLAINQVTASAMEPSAGAEAVSDKYSFVTSTFLDEFNLVHPAEHQRTTAIIRLDESHGYYLDIFRAKSDIDSQYHDYLYRNLADSLHLTMKGQPIPFEADDNRYQSAMNRAWKQDQIYKHPGWHVFSDVKSAKMSSESMKATFTANHLDSEPIHMQATVVAGLNVTVTQAKAPKSKIERKPYKDQLIPIFLLRHEGDTWQNPFVVTYESYSGKKSPVIQRTERLMHGENFKGVYVVSELGSDMVEQYVLVQQNLTDEYIDDKIQFVGTFGIVTLINGELKDLYIGHGNNLSYQQNKLKTVDGITSAYQEFK